MFITLFLNFEKLNSLEGLIVDNKSKVLSQIIDFQSLMLASTEFSQPNFQMIALYNFLRELKTDLSSPVGI